MLMQNQARRLKHRGHDPILHEENSILIGDEAAYHQVNPLDRWGGALSNLPFFVGRNAVMLKCFYLASVPYRPSIR